MRVVIVDDHEFMRDGLRMFVEGPACSGEALVAGSCAEAVALLQTETVDLVLLDWRLPDVSGIDSLERLRALPNPPRVIVVSADDDPATARAALDGGALGFVRKSATSDVLQAAIQLVLAGERYVPSHLLGLLHRVDDPVESTGGLSPRQADVLAELARGASSREISEMLGLAESTVRAHVAEICRRLGVNSRLQAAQTELARSLAARRRRPVPGRETE